MLCVLNGAWGVPLSLGKIDHPTPGDFQKGQKMDEKMNRKIEREKLKALIAGILLNSQFRQTKIWEATDSPEDWPRTAKYCRELADECLVNYDMLMSEIEGDE